MSYERRRLALETEQFIASLVGSLAWPAAVVCIAVVFRNQLKTLLTDQLRHIEAGPIKADFDRAASKVEATLGKAGIAVPVHAEAPHLTGLTAQVPEMVIAEAFGLVEQVPGETPRRSSCSAGMLPSGATTRSWSVGLLALAVLTASVYRAEGALKAVNVVFLPRHRAGHHLGLLSPPVG